MARQLSMTPGAIKRRAWRAANPERERANWTNWHKENKDKLRDADRRYAKKHPDRLKEKEKRRWKNKKKVLSKKNKKYHQIHAVEIAARHRLNLHQMSKDIHAEMLQEQGNSCAICKEPFKKTPHIDHDHTCRHKRGSCAKCRRALLCDDCNLGIGRFKDNIEILTSAIEYIRFWKEKHETISTRPPRTK